MTAVIRRWLLVLSVAVVLIPATSAIAWGNGLAKTYLGESFGSTLPVLPTSYEHQDKMWFHDDAWWAIMDDPAARASRIFELLPDHTWRPTDPVINDSPSDLGDALQVGDSVYIVSRAQDGFLEFRRLAFDEAERRYVPAAAEPVVITTQGAKAPASIAKDAEGRLWVSFATTTEVLVAYSDDDGTSWTEPFAPTVPGGAGVSPGEVSAVVAFGDRVAVMWSDQTQNMFRFAIHPVGSPDEVWTVETPLAGLGMVDNHISLKSIGRGPDATVIAAVKTSQGDKGEPGSSPLIMVLKRGLDGVWSTAVGSTVSDRMDSPHLQIDESNDTVYLFTYGSGGVYGKQSALQNLSFETGRGTPFIVTGRATLGDPTGSNDPVDATTGLVVLASGTADHRYSHSELALPISDAQPAAAQGDVEPPTIPTDLLAVPNASGTITLSWSPATDGDRWSPASDGVPVAGYAVYRDGTELDTTDKTSFADSPPANDTRHEYSVRAVDQAGNQSAPVTVLLSPQATPAGTGRWVYQLLGLGIVAVAVGLLVLRRWRVRGNGAPYDFSRVSMVDSTRFGPSTDA